MAEIGSAEFDDSNVRDFLDNMSLKLRNIKDGKKQYAGLIGVNIFQDIDQHFKDEQGPQGGWPIWSINYADVIYGRAAWRTINRKKVRFDLTEESGDSWQPKPPRKPGLILQATGRLRQNFMPQKYRATSAGLLWYNNAKTKGGFPYAYAHNEGGPQLPKREFMWLSKEGMQQVELQTIWFMLEKGL